MLLAEAPGYVWDSAPPPAALCSTRSFASLLWKKDAAMAVLQLMGLSLLKYVVVLRMASASERKQFDVKIFKL